MIKVIQIAVCITQIFRFVDCAVLDRNRIDVNGNQDFNSLVNPILSTDIGGIFSGSIQNSGSIDLMEELSNKPSYITEEAEIPPDFLIPQPLTTELLSSQTRIEKATTQTGLLASPQVDNSLTTLMNSAPTEQNVASVEDKQEEAPIQGLENLASVITEEIPNFDESEDEDKNPPNSEEYAEDIESFEQINNETVEEIGDEEIDEHITISEKNVAINDDDVDDDADEEEEQQEPSENTKDLKSLLISKILGRFSESEKSLDDDDDNEDKDEPEEVDEADDNSGLKSIFGILGRTSQKEDEQVSNSITSMKEDSINTEIDGNIEEEETSEEEEAEDESPEEDEMLTIMLKFGNKTITISKAMNELAKSIKAVSSSCEGLTEENIICRKNEDKKQDDYKNENTPIETLINDEEADESIFNVPNPTETNSNIDDTAILPTMTILSESNVKPALLSPSF